MCAPPCKRPSGARARRLSDRAPATPCKPTSLKSAPLGRARAAFATARLGKPPKHPTRVSPNPFPQKEAVLRSVLRANALRLPRYAPTPPFIILPCRIARHSERVFFLFGLHLPLGRLRRLGVGAGAASGTASRAVCSLPSANHPDPA